MKRSEVHTYGWNGYNQKPAVNVKVWGDISEADIADVRADLGLDERFTLAWIEEHVSDERQSDWFWQACSGGFEQLQEDAQELFGSRVKVWAEGRQGRWAVVDGLSELETWDAVALGKWARFAKWARQQADDVPRAMAWLIAANVFEPWAQEQDDPARLASGHVCSSCLAVVA